MHCMKTAFLSNKIQYICISLLLWTMHINTISDFIRSTHLIISWFIMIYRDLSWYFLIFLDKSWYITMYHDLSWFITIYHDISWFPTVLGEVNDECHCHTDFCPINHLIQDCGNKKEGSYPQLLRIADYMLSRDPLWVSPRTSSKSFRLTLCRVVTHRN